MPFSFEKQEIAGLVVVTPRAFPDGRGLFLESYKKSEFVANGITNEFVQDNHSVSSKGVLRGLHFQKPPKAQAKLVRVVKGAVWDVAVDVRADSPTYLKWLSIELTEENKKMFYIPVGFAHGFVSLVDDTVLVYKCTEEYDPSTDSGIRWDDPALKIPWPVTSPLVSEKDQALGSCSDLGRVF